ncbi:MULTISPECIES: S8 family serine peptidase [unclassified Bacteroides]|uniref:S8 family serine peptidase n=1 Tax=unclassified Bacteroides TaxID=2646097 RepID=UPI004063B1ED
MNILKRFYQIAGAGLIFSVSVLIGCQNELIEDARSTESAIRDAKNFKAPLLPGQAYVKFKSANTRAASSLSETLKFTTSLTRSGSAPQTEPVFDISGPYKEAMIREGLHLWYKVIFDKTADVHQVIEELKTHDDIEIAHGALKIVNSQATYTPLTRASRRKVPDVNDGYNNFNDPLLRKQWHYRNLGERGVAYQFEEGADINLFEAWNKTTGDKRVVVAILDSGIDITHPDLKDAMWKSPQGGYSGKNFVSETHQIDPGFHGTHVGGTIAARNNNNRGVGGVAGGNGNADTGVRLMSCQIFGADKANGGTQGTAGPDAIARAFVWAADNGAVLANCSWGYGYNKKDYPNAELYADTYRENGRLIQTGIDYFVKYAGRNQDGVTKREGSLMAGGVIFFASGNGSGRDIPIVPACDPSVIAVSSFGADYRLAEYSNTGDWVDICAPGGDMSYDIARGVLSTVPRNFKNILIAPNKPGSEYIYPGDDMTDDSEHELYAFANGTSMATPHVTGIAALMVSYFGNKDNDFTADKLRKRILGAVKARNIHKGGNSDMILRNKMGVGYIDAGFALRDPETEKPENVSTIENKIVKYYDATVAWNVTADSDSPTGVAYAYDLYLSERELTQLPNQPTATVYTYEAQKGEKLEYQFTGLNSEHTYHVAIQAHDRNGNKSEITRGKFKTLLNNAPVFTNPLSERILILNTRPYYTYTFNVEEKDGHKWDFKTERLPAGVTVTRNGDNLKMTILVGETTGTYDFDIVLTDELKGTHTETVRYAIVAHNAPTVKARIGDIFLTEGDKPMNFSVKDIFELAPGIENPTFEAVTNNPAVVDARIENGTVTLTPKAKGEATVIVIVDDGKKKSQTTFQVKVTNENASEVQALYPLPAHSHITMLIRSNVAKADVSVISVRGERLINESLVVNPVSREATLSVDKLAPGIYHLIIKTNRATSKRTFIKN